jgi:hypothetical protein
MTLESLEFIIYPDGRVKETVTGIQGRSCQEITAAIEAQLGRVVAQETTAAYFQPALTPEVSVQSTCSASQW